MDFEGKFFHFEYEKADNELAGTIISIAEDTYEKVTAQFQIPVMKDRFTFKICPDIATFIKATGKTAETYQPWMVGSADYTQRFVCILSPRVICDRSLADMLKIVKHEVVHIVFDSLSNPDKTPIGIGEGIAVCIAGQVNPDSLHVNEPPSMIGLNDEDYFYENDGYNYSGVYVRHFLEKFGIEDFKKIYTGTERLDAYLYDGFEAEAIREIKKAISPTPGDCRKPFP